MITHMASSGTSLQPSIDKKLGYRFHRRTRPTAPGYSQLDIILKAAPTRGYFDPEYVRASICSPAGSLEFLTMQYGGDYGGRYQVCPDRIIMRDRGGKIIEAFTFGGELQIESQEDMTICSISSEAPLLELSGELALPTMLAVEVEALLTEQQIASRPTAERFEACIAQLNPLALYAACLLDLKDKISRRAPAQALQAQLLHVVIAEIDELKDMPIFEQGFVTLEQLFH